MKHEPSPAASPTELDSAIASSAREALRGAQPRLTEAMLYSLLGPGKRIRPRIVLAVSDALGLPRDIALTIASALEMTHAYTLVHDDLPAMDDDDFRRGRPTNHKVYGEGLAVLAGDSLALLAPRIILGLRDRLPAERVLALTTALLDASGAHGVISGQAAEMDLAPSKSESSLASLYEIFRLKTGALFRASLSLPALAAGAEPKLVEALGKFGDELGIAFQIADDLEDDFTAKKSDPAHIAAYLAPAKARTEAEIRLEIDPTLPPALRENLAPFIDELRKKISGTVA